MISHPGAHGAEELTVGSARGLHGSTRGAIAMVALALILATSPAARAEPIQYDFGGVITAAPSGSGIAVGDPFTGSFRYDPAQGTILEIEGFNSFTTNPNQPNASAFSLNINGHGAVDETGALSWSVQYTPWAPGDPTPPSLTIHFGDSNGYPGVPSIGLTFANPDRLPDDSVMLPGKLVLSDFTTAQLDYKPSGSVEYTGTILALTPVPEPAYAVIICLAAGWVVGSRCRAVREAD
jgi:hypothetical protein